MPVDTQGQPLNWLDVLHGVLFAPRQTFTRLSARPPLALGTAVFVTVALVNAVVAARMAPPSLPAWADALLPVDGAWLLDAAAAFGFWVSLLALPATAAVIHLAAELLGGRGRAQTLIALLGLAHLPKALTAPLALLEQRAGLPVLAALGLAVESWRLYLLYRAVRAGYDLPRWRAVAALSAPFLLLAALLLGAAVLAATVALRLLPMFDDLPPL